MTFRGVPELCDTWACVRENMLHASTPQHVAFVIYVVACTIVLLWEEPSP